MIRLFQQGRRRGPQLDRGEKRSLAERKRRIRPLDSPGRLSRQSGRNVILKQILAQALQRKHEGLERDLVALGEHVFSLDEKASQLYKQFPEQEEAIRSKQSEINKAWNDLVSKVLR